jgi:hypothetical protein
MTSSHRQGIGAGHDDKILIASGVQGGTQLLHMLLHRYHELALKETTLFGENLILDVATRHASRLVVPDGTGDVDGVAIPRVGIADDRDIYGVGDVAGVLDHLCLRQQSHIRIAAFGGSAKACHIGDWKAHHGGNLRVVGIEYEGRYHHPVAA